MKPIAPRSPQANSLVESGVIGMTKLQVNDVADILLALVKATLSKVDGNEGKADE